MEGFLFPYMERFDYENLFLCQDQSISLRAIIAIHDTTLGPATGGCRMWTYASEREAIEDALRLARGMTYKYAAAGVNLGGGKCVVMGDPKTDKSEALFRALGRFIHRLHGLYITGEDVGTTLRDMEYIRMETPYVVTLPQSWGGAGPIAPATALGVVEGMKACTQEVFGTADLAGRTVAVQGLGMVGAEIVSLLVEAQAKVYVADIDADKVQRLTDRFHVSAVSAAAIATLEVDIFCPCALGGIINDTTLDALRCNIIAGSANNQLQDADHGERLRERGILYAPDYIVNAGGTIYDTDRLLPGGFNAERAMEKVKRIGETMATLIRLAKAEHISTARAADVLAERRLDQVRKAHMLAAGGEGRLT